METQTVVTLLTIAVILLSVVILALLTLVVIVLVKVKKITASIDRISNNVASASEWLSPTKLFSEALRAFRR